MTESIVDHDRLDVYRLSIDYVAASFVAAKQLDGHHRHARDQWLRAAQSIPLNITEGNGKRSLKDRNRFLDFARGSALECAAIQDILSATDGLDTERHGELKRSLKRIVSMLTRLIARADAVAEAESEYEYEYEYEYRDAEYEYDGCAEPGFWMIAYCEFSQGTVGFHSGTLSPGIEPSTIVSRFETGLIKASLSKLSSALNHDPHSPQISCFTDGRGVTDFRCRGAGEDRLQR